MEISLEDLQSLFDMCIGSMDFGSGMLDTEQVDLLRRVAVQLGVDPLEEATPEEFISQYPHPFKARQKPEPSRIPFTRSFRPVTEEELREYEETKDRCIASRWRCGKAPDDPIHQEVKP